MPGSFRSKVDLTSKRPSRSSLNTGESSSNSSLIATSNESIDIVERRNFAWKGLIRELGSYYEELANVYSNVSKGLEKAASVIELPSKDPGLLLGSSQLGVLRLVGALRESNLHLAESYQDCAVDALEKAELLRKLREEIKQRNKNMRTEHSSLNSKLTKALETSPSFHVSALDPEIDPWLNFISIQRQLHQGINDENSCNKSISMSFNSLAGFDASVLKRIKNIVNGHLTVKTDGFHKSIKRIDHIKKLFGNVPDDIEWRGFKSRFPDVVPDKEAEVRSVEEIRTNSKLVPVREGYLGRKTGVGMFKSWKSFFCVLTSSGFLHGFASKDFTCDAVPDFSINLRKSLMSVNSETDQDSSFTFEIIDTASWGLFSNEKSYLLKAESQNDCKIWVENLSSVLDKGTKLETRSTKSSSSRNVVHKTSLLSSKINTEEVQSNLSRNVDQGSLTKKHLEKTNTHDVDLKTEQDYLEKITYTSTNSQASLNALVKNQSDVASNSSSSRKKSVDVSRENKSKFPTAKHTGKINREQFYNKPYNNNAPTPDYLSVGRHHNKTLPLLPLEPARKLDPLVIFDKPLPDSPLSSPIPLTPNRSFNFPAPPTSKLNC